MRAACSKPRLPVAAFALPELTTTMRIASWRARSLVSTTGAARMPLRVKRVALTQSGAEQTISPTSMPPLGLMPARHARGAEARREVAGVLGDVTGQFQPA